MSIKTWKEEFYPVKPRKSMTTKEAIEHSLRKWEGLRKSNLKKHGLEQVFWGDAILESVGDERGDQSVYGKWVDGGNPVLMITALKKCLRKEEKND